MNHRFLLRLVTNLAVFLLMISCFGLVLWVIDEIVLWDILPDAWSLIVRALLVAGGIISFVLVVMNVMLSLALLAESNASRAELPNYGISTRVKRRVRQSIVIVIVAIALLIGGLQITDHLRSQAAARETQLEFTQAQNDLNTALDQVLDLFSPPLLEAIETNTLSEKGQLGNLSKLLSAVQTSFPHSPTATLIVPAAQPPFKYARINSSNIRSAGNGSKLSLAPQLYATFPTAKETEVIEQLFAGKLPTLQESLSGQVINNTVPSSWGVLKRNGKVIAILYLQSNTFPGIDPALPSPYSSLPSPYHHSGPKRLIY